MTEEQHTQQPVKVEEPAVDGASKAVGSENGSANRYYNKNYQCNGYNKPYRNSMSPGAVPGMQWQGYYGSQPMYYAPQTGGQPDIPIPTASSSSKKIEITTKTGEQLDLDTLHSKHAAEASKDTEVTASASFASASASNDTEELSEAEKNRRAFLEQIRLRKLALEKKKQEGSQTTESSAEQPAEAKTEEPQTEEAPVKKELTFAEKLRMKKLQQSHEVEAKESSETPVAASADSEVETPKEESTDDVTPTAESETMTDTNAEAASEDSPVKEEVEDSTIVDDEPDTRISMTEFLNVLREAKPIEDIYAFQYPSYLESPDSRYKKEHIKYTYGPAFLLQFKEKISAKPDSEWVESTASKIVIPPGMGRSNKPKDGKFGMGSRMGSSRDFSKNGSLRNMDGRSNSRNNSKRRSKRGGDDRRSNRSYTSRKDRERGEEDRLRDDTPKEDVAPLVPSANRWVPKSKQQTTEKKFAPDGVTELLEKDDAKRKMKSLLNKLTLEKFDTISTDILAIANLSKWEIKSETLKVVIEELFLKACDEPHWSSMYAQLCGKLVKDLDPEIKDEENEGKTGPKLVLHFLVDRCHTEFEKGWADKLPTNPDGTPLEVEMMSEEYYQAATAKRRGLGLVRFIGHLYRLNLLTGKMMFECFRRLMRDLAGTPSEEILESVIELLSTVGEQFETDSFKAGPATLEGSVLLDSLFELLQTVINSGNILSRIKFKLIELKELREKNWNGMKKDEGPKTISQIHEEDERQRLLKEMKNNSRSSSRRNIRDMSSRATSKRDRDVPAVSKDNFTTTRSTSARHTQRTPTKEEPKPQPQMAAANMFSALMGSDEEEE